MYWCPLEFYFIKFYVDVMLLICVGTWNKKQRYEMFCGMYYKDIM